MEGGSIDVQSLDYTLGWLILLVGTKLLCWMTLDALVTKNPFSCKVYVVMIWEQKFSKFYLEDRLKIPQCKGPHGQQPCMKTFFIYYVENMQEVNSVSLHLLDYLNTCGPQECRLPRFQQNVLRSMDYGKVTSWACGTIWWPPLEVVSNRFASLGSWSKTTLNKIYQQITWLVFIVNKVIRMVCVRTSLQLSKDVTTRCGVVWSFWLQTYKIVIAPFHVKCSWRCTYKNPSWKCLTNLRMQ